MAGKGRCESVLVLSELVIVFLNLLGMSTTSSECHAMLVVRQERTCLDMPTNPGYSNCLTIIEDFKLFTIYEGMSI